MRSARKKRLRVGMKNQRHIDAVHYIYGVLSIQHATYSVYPDFRVLSKTLSESARAVPRQAVGVCGRGVQQRCAQAGLLACRGPSGWLCRRRKQDARPRKGRAQVAPVKARSGIVLAPGGDMFVAGDIADGVVPHQRRAQPGAHRRTVGATEPATALALGTEPTHLRDVAHQVVEPGGGGVDCRLAQRGGGA